MKKEVKIIDYIIRGTGIVFWFNLLNLLFNKDTAVELKIRLIMMVSSLLIGYGLVKIKKQIHI